VNRSNLQSRYLPDGRQPPSQLHDGPATAFVPRMKRKWIGWLLLQHIARAWKGNAAWYVRFAVCVARRGLKASSCVSTCFLPSLLRLQAFRFPRSLQAWLRLTTSPLYCTSGTTSSGIMSCMANFSHGFKSLEAIAWTERNSRTHFAQISSVTSSPSIGLSGARAARWGTGMRS
jgi:hypothetical protein